MAQDPRDPRIRIYLDVCCLNRPFDDQTQDRIRLEAEAVLVILKHAVSGECHWVGSEVLDIEIAETPDPRRRTRVKLMAQQAHETVNVEEDHRIRARELRALGLRPVDALHVACAESAKVDYFFTTDDKMLRAAARHSAALRVKVVNPLAWPVERTEQ